MSGQHDIRLLRTFGVIIAVLTIAIVIALWAISSDSKQEVVKEVVVLEQPATTVVRFAAVGDIGANENADAVLEKIAEAQPDLTLALGDLSYGEESEHAWCERVKNAVGATHPFQLIAGNHDLSELSADDAQADIHTFATCLPNRMPEMEGIYAENYFFDYTNLVRFIMISPDLEIGGREYSYEEGQPDYDWLSNTIDAARDENITWVVVGMHKNCLTLGVKRCEIGTDLLELLAQKRVDLVLQGHEHGYYRSKQLVVNTECTRLHPDGFEEACVNNGEDNKVYQKGAGTVLAISGAGGKKLRDIDVERPEIPFFAYWSGKNIDPAYGPMIVDVSETGLEAYFSATDGNTRDQFQITNFQD